MKKIPILEIGKDVLNNEAKSIRLLSRKLGDPYISAVKCLYSTKGKIVISGIGKSGIVARKIAATFSSTGTTSFFVHPVEALHGDLGIVVADDTVIVISHSGETQEILNFVRAVKHFKVKIIAITAGEKSSLAALSDIVLQTFVEKEACQSCTTFNLAPTASALVQLALGDALSAALQEMKGFKREHFARLHPGGDIGKNLQM